MVTAGETEEEHAAKLGHSGESLDLADNQESNPPGLREEKLSETAPASAPGFCGQVFLTKTKRNTAEEHNVKRALPPTITVPVGGLEARGQEETERDEDRAQEHTSLSLGNSTEDQGDASVRQRQEHSNEKLLRPQRTEEGNLSPPFLLVVLLVLFSFLYVGTEIGFGAWVAVVVVERIWLRRRALPLLLGTPRTDRTMLCCSAQCRKFGDFPL